MTTTVLHLEGLTCGHCVASTRKALEAVSGTTKADVELNKAVVESSASAQALIDAVEEAGYQATVA